MELPRRAVVLAEDETHLNLLPHVSTGEWAYRLGKRRAADFIALLDQVLAAFSSAPAIVMICDNDSIHHARKVTAYLEDTPGWSCCTAARSPDQMLATAAPWTIPWLPGRYEQSGWNVA